MPTTSQGPMESAKWITKTFGPDSILLATRKALIAIHPCEIGRQS